MYWYMIGIVFNFSSNGSMSFFNKYEGCVHDFALGE